MHRRTVPPTRNASAPASRSGISPTALADATQRVLEQRAAARRGAPAVHTSDRSQRYTQRDYDLMALDNGAHREGMERRARTNEEVRRDRIDSRDGTVRDEDGRAVRNTGAFRKRQFTEMRGQRTRGAASGVPTLGNDSPVGLRISGFLAYMAMAQGDPQKAYRIAKEHGADPVVIRTLGESTISAGGATIPEVMVEDYIELLYASTVYLQGNPMRLDAPGGNLTLPKIATGAMGGWIGENANVPKSAPTFGQVKVDLKYLGVLVPIANRLIRHSPMAVETLVRDDLVANASVLIDTAAIRGTGSVHQPKGLRQMAAAANVFAQTGTSVAAITTDTAKMQRLLEDAKMKFVRPYWMMAPRTRWGLMAARDGNNNLVWADEMSRGEFQGKPFGVTQSIPTNLGGGSDSELYLVDMIHQIFAEGVGDDGLRVEARDGVAYHDGSQVVAAFSQDQTVVRLIQSADIVSRQDGNEISVLTGVTIA
jgi:HK97 family phage major capsid protein